MPNMGASHMPDWGSGGWLSQAGLELTRCTAGSVPASGPRAERRQRDDSKNRDGQGPSRMKLEELVVMLGERRGCGSDLDRFSLLPRCAGSGLALFPKPTRRIASPRQHQLNSIGLVLHASLEILSLAVCWPLLLSIVTSSALRNHAALFHGLTCACSGKPPRSCPKLPEDELGRRIAAAQLCKVQLPSDSSPSKPCQAPDDRRQYPSLSSCLWQQICRCFSQLLTLVALVPGSGTSCVSRPLESFGGSFKPGCR